MEELLGALMQAGMTHDQAERVALAVSQFVDVRISEHIAIQHATKAQEPKPRAKKPQARRRWKKR